jgi:hypothetical protein
MSSRSGPIQVPVGPLIGAIGGAILLVSLFLDWYDGLTGFTVFEFVDIVLVVCAVLIMVQLAGGMGLLEPPLSPALSLVVSLFAIGVVLTQVVNDPPAVAGGGPDQAVGIWLAVGGAALMVVGAVLATAHISLAVEPRDHAAEGRAADDEAHSEAATQPVRSRRRRDEPEPGSGPEQP